mmetsp:Transcript_55/g.216  ORF Transcript_55/g.216 Transcript_55/m.216 type:complete len:209 (-) Transcript_55:786-1412(-)
MSSRTRRVARPSRRLTSLANGSISWAARAGEGSSQTWAASRPIASACACETPTWDVSPGWAPLGTSAPCASDPRWCRDVLRLHSLLSVAFSRTRTRTSPSPWACSPSTRSRSSPTAVGASASRRSSPRGASRGSTSHRPRQARVRVTSGLCWTTRRARRFRWTSAISSALGTSSCPSSRTTWSYQTALRPRSRPWTWWTAWPRSRLCA